MEETNTVSVYVALNGIDYTFAGDMTIQNTIAKVALVFYDSGMCIVSLLIFLALIRVFKFLCLCALTIMPRFI